MIKACDDNGYDDDNHDDNDILDIVTASLLMNVFRSYSLFYNMNSQLDYTNIGLIRKKSALGKK